MADGTIDIVIGTHALLAKGIEFQAASAWSRRRGGQRFGVVCTRSGCKALKTDVHA